MSTAPRQPSKRKTLRIKSPTTKVGGLTEQERSDLKFQRCGRKPLFRNVMITEGYKLGGLGLTLEEVADFWNVNRKSLQRWTHKHPELVFEIQKGKRNADAMVVDSLYQAAKGGNMTACIFWLKNRQPGKWKDVHKIEGSGFGGDTHFHIDRRITFTAVPEDSDADGGASGVHAPESSSRLSEAEPVQGP